jgi:hypothetical protein
MPGVRRYRDPDWIPPLSKAERERRDEEALARRVGQLQSALDLFIERVEPHLALLVLDRAVRTTLAKLDTA